MHFFLLTQNEHCGSRKDFPSGNKQITENTSPAGLSLEEFVTADNGNVCTAPNRADKDILEFVQISKNIIDTDSVDENEMNKQLLFKRHPKSRTS
ncbi:hypothetical protein TNCV_1339961 [Trichonephila clavipes]|uniref:Uncharacterized protein n=1 Tax=Trichonephila clavipes TaxID=2585209 RepID=A0A8X6UZ27_TRICX|nr:hypothetical protein TNCV_1339961 [Trichonephila clavipes]